jgi:hypothetical protein
MNAMALQDLVLTFKNSSKNYDCLHPLFVKIQMKKKTTLGPSKVKSIKKMKRHIPFVFLNKGTQNFTFLKLFPWPLIWNIKIILF